MRVRRSSRSPGAAGVAGPSTANVKTLERRFSLVVALVSFVVPRAPGYWVLKHVGLRVLFPLTPGVRLVAVSLDAFEGSHLVHPHKLASKKISACFAHGAQQAPLGIAARAEKTSLHSMNTTDPAQYWLGTALVACQLMLIAARAALALAAFLAWIV